MPCREAAASTLTRLHHRHARVSRSRALASVLPQVIGLGATPRSELMAPNPGTPCLITCQRESKLPRLESPSKNARMTDTNQRRTHRLSVRVTEAEHAALLAKAEAADVELAVYIRSVVLSDTNPVRSRGKTLDTVALGKAIGSLNKVGGLMNQIAKQANLVGDLSSFREAQADRAQLAEAVRAMMAALGELRR